MKQMSLIEMDGFLKGKCIPRDLKVNETNAEYLVRKFAEAEAKYAALAAENAGLNDKMNKLLVWPGIEFYSSAWEFCNLDGNDALELMCDNKTPVTDAFLAEVRAQGVEMFADHLLCPDLDDTIRDFAAQLRKGGEQK
ncbi:TPA: hypothetical protein ACWSZA_002249 [Escherichia coli]|uniref:hypothetical protein n=1 Tax=Escherichia coli TaxID=562 RepID=UPI00351D8E86